MKVTIVFLTVALFAVLANASPVPEPEADAAALKIGNPLKKVAEAAKNLFKKICKNKEGDNKCKKWAKKNITWANVLTFVKELKPFISEYCESDEEKEEIIKVGCTLAQAYL